MKVKTIILPPAERILIAVGENIKLARKRRRWTMEDMVDRCGISRPTLSFIEKGSPKVAIGKYMSVMLALGLESHFLLLGKNDEIGRHLQDSQLMDSKSYFKEKK